MTYNDALALIQAEIVANGNNEITANVLRPVLEAMINFPNDSIGVLANLTTSDVSSVVNAINSIVSENLPNSTALRAIDTTGIDFDQDELLWVRDAINQTAVNNGSFTCNLGQQMVFYFDVIINNDGSEVTLQRRYYRLTTGETTVNSLGTGDNPPLMPDGTRIVNVSLSGDLIIDLGDIGTDTIEDAFNSDPNQPFTIVGDKFIQAIQNSENKLWQWIGGDGTFGNSATLAEATDFVDLTSSTPPPNGNPNLQEVTDSGNTTTNDIQVPDVHSDQDTETQWFRINKDYLSIGNFGDGAGDPYGGSWSNSLSIFDPDNLPNGLGFYASGGGNESSTLELNGANGTFNINCINPLTSFQTQITNNGYLLRIAVISDLNEGSILEFEPPTVVGNHEYKIPARTDSPTTSYLALSVNEKYADSEGKVVLTEEDIIGTATYDATVTGATNIDLETFASSRLILTGNATITFTGTPASGESITRTFIITSNGSTETLGIANSDNEYGSYDPTAINKVVVEATNYPTVGLIIDVAFNQAN